MRQYGIDAVPFQHSQIDEWRENVNGVQFYHAPTNLIVTGAVDDLWINPAGKIIAGRFPVPDAQRRNGLHSFRLRQGTVGCFGSGCGDGGQQDGYDDKGE